MIAAALLLFAAALVLSALSRPQEGHLVRTRWLVSTAWLCCVAGAVVAVGAGALAVSGTDQTLGIGTIAGLGVANLHLDPLSGLFAVITFAVAAPAALAAATGGGSRPRLPAAVALALAAVLVVLGADHLFLLLFGWESLTVAFYLLAGFDRAKDGRPRAAIAAVGFGKLSGAALLLGGTLLAAHAHTFILAGFSRVPGVTGAGAVGYALLLFGFAVKVGAAPVQVWLPPSYSAAPGPARAIMAGAAVNVGFYGMWRTLDVLGRPPIWLATVVLVVGGVTAILGIAHAAVHPRLTGLVAWSSVENAGLITTGFGVALAGSAAGDQALAAAGLLGATAQVIAHALGKSLLFTATAAIETAAGTTRLDVLRGIARRAPWAGTGLVVGALTLAGLPLTAGFASEWLVLESLMQQFRIDSLPMQLASAFAGGLVALTIGVAGVTFVRLVALTAFGSPPSPLRHQAPDRRQSFRTAIGLLATACLAVAALAPLEVRLIAAGLRPLVGDRTFGALAKPWVIQPVFGDFSALSPSWLWLALPTLTALAAALAFAFSGRRLVRVRRVPAWSSGSPGPDRGVGYTSFAYANPMRKVLANLLLTRAELATLTKEQHGQPARSGPRPTVALADVRQAWVPDSFETADDGGSGEIDDPLGEAAPASPALTYRVDVVEVVERYVYRPAAGVLLALSRVSRRLQSGRLDAYMAYMLIVLIAVLAVVTATA